jgi:hypothetical protein
MNRKFLLIGRHGECPQLQPPKTGSIDMLYPASVQRMYENGEGISDLICTAEGKTFVRHSNKIRTVHSAQAMLAGIFGLVPSVLGPKPDDEAHLEHYDWSGYDFSMDMAMCMPSPFCNNDVYMKNKGDPTENINFWLQNPYASWHPSEDSTDGGRLIVPYAVLDGIVSNAARGQLEKLDKNGYGFGMNITHSGIPEAYAIGLINAGRTPITDVADIGGPFGMEEFALLTIEGKKAELKIRDNKYKVNLSEYLKRAIH